jgi:hypothetical protein
MYVATSADSSVAMVFSFVVSAVWNHFELHDSLYLYCSRLLTKIRASFISLSLFFFFALILHVHGGAYVVIYPVISR